MKLNIPVDSIESKYLTPDLRKKINGSEQVVNNYITNNQITNINGVVKAKCVATTNIALNNTTTIIDDYTCLNNDIILVVGQTDKKENGVYRYDTTFIRYDFEVGELVAVLNGTNYANSLWKNTNNELIVGTTLIDFEQIHIINVINDIPDVNINAPINNEVLTYKGGEWVNLPVESLPAGTIDQTLRHNGTDWVANSIFKITDISASNKRALFDLYSVGNACVIVNKELTGTFNNCLQLQLNATPTTSRKLIDMICNSVNRFYVNSFGTIFSNSLTANSLLQANANKEIVSMTGTTNQTIRHNGTGWVAGGVLFSESDNARVNANRNGNAFSVTNSHASGTALQLSVSGTGNSIHHIDGTTNKFIVKKDGTIFSNSLTANTYLGANANKEIVSIQSPNQIRYVPEDRTSTDALSWQDAVISLNVEAGVTYELVMQLVFGNTAGRNGELKLTGSDFIYKPIVTGNVNSISDSVIIMRDTANVKPESLGTGETYTFQTTGFQSSLIEFRGILISDVPEVNFALNFRTLDDGSALVLKQYSYVKLSR